jgi:hypothetical protein
MLDFGEYSMKKAIEVLEKLRDGRPKHWTQLGLPKGTASSVLSALAKEGLVRRVDQGYYEITKKGEEVLTTYKQYLLAEAVSRYTFRKKLEEMGVKLSKKTLERMVIEP